LTGTLQHKGAPDDIRFVDAAKRYRKELDLIFHEIDEDELHDGAESEPRGMFVLRLLNFSGMCVFLKSVPEEQYPEIIQACVERRFSKEQTQR